MATLPLPAPLPELTAPASWRAIDFISDLHLGEATPAIFAAWSSYLRSTDADAVLILGDLFDAWIGDDVVGDAAGRSLDVLKDASARRTIAFMAGNRDFLVGDPVLEAVGVRRLVDPTVVVAFGRRTLVSHGDALCLGDVAYQRYRRVARSRLGRRAYLALPTGVRRAIAGALGRGSGRGGAGAPRRHVDVDEETAVDWLRAADATTLVHGHTHHPAVHPLGGGERHVLGAWDLDEPDPSPAEIVRWTADGFARRTVGAASTT